MALLKYLPANEGCPAKSEVLLGGFCARLYCNILAASEGYLLHLTTAITQRQVVLILFGTSFGFLVKSNIFPGSKAYQEYLSSQCSLIYKKIIEDQDHRGCKKIGQAEGAQDENNYSIDTGKQ